MTLGLAVGDKQGLYLAIESTGLPLPESWSLLAKVHDLQNKPLVAMLTAGGLAHWNDVVREFRPQASVASAAAEVTRILDNHMGPQNQAYGLLCGYQEGLPKCYRINRRLGDTAASIAEEPLSSTRGLGDPELAHNATQLADEAILHGHEKLLALVEAIQAHLPTPGHPVKGPVQVRVIRP
jgi:hypothetical protein